MSIFEFIVLALATFRAARMFTDETGPGKVFARIRAVAGTDDRDATGNSRHLAGQILDCCLCCSLWAGAGLYAVWLFFPWAWPGVIVLALSGVACLLYLGSNRA